MVRKRPEKPGFLGHSENVAQATKDDENNGKNTKNSGTE